jgi:amino acid transporter
MSEEALHAAKAVPLGIIWSAGSAFVLGFLVLSIIAATMNPDVNVTLSTSFGQPMAQVYYDALGRDGALVFMAILCLIQFLIGLSLLVAASRQAWAFSRDGALPFSGFFRHISKRIKYQPVRVICGLVVVCLMLGLLCLINSAATNALFSLFIASNYLSWGTPIFCRIFWGQDQFRPGEFYTGRLSKPIAYVAVVYLLFGVVLSMFPAEGPNPSGISSRELYGTKAEADYLYSIGYELHYRHQWVCLGWLHGVLLYLCSTLVYRTTDDYQGKRCYRIRQYWRFPDIFPSRWK